MQIVSIRDFLCAFQHVKSFNKFWKYLESVRETFSLVTFSREKNERWGTNNGKITATYETTDAKCPSYK